MPPRNRVSAKRTSPAKRTLPVAVRSEPGPELPTSPTNEQNEAIPVTADATKPRTAHCNVPDCRRAPEHRGLCTPHWGTHRGFADPKEKETAR